MTILTSLVLALGLSVGVLGLGALFAHARTAELDDRLSEQMSTLQTLVGSDQLTQPLPVPPGSPVLAQVVDSAGTVLASSLSAGRVLALVPPASIGSMSGHGPLSTSETGFGAGRLRVLVEPAQLRNTPVSIVTAASMADLTSTLDQLRRVLFLVAPLTVLAAGLASWAALGAALRPVDEMRAAADSIGGSVDPELTHAKLPVPPSDDEIGRLAVTLNRMLERLQASSRQQRDFAADAAHELRTPLATLLAELEVARARGDAADWDGVADEAIAQARRMSLLIDDLLLLARADADRLGPREAIDLAAVVASTLESDRWASGAGPIRVVGEVAEPHLDVRGDQAALERVLTNLLDNAVRHARTTVVVSLTVDGPGAELVVCDDGPGVPSEQLNLIFDRFYRADPSRSRGAAGDGGAGLGLAIARSVVRAHGGEVSAAERPGGGLCVRVTLPTDTSGTGTGQSPARSRV
ncbi:MAG: sensor histidine kinase [Actinomycetes bacterium]